MLFERHIIGQIVNCAIYADRLIRSELIEGIITGENDYTSNFTAQFRREINAFAHPKLKARSFVLPNSDEQKMGVDAAIILANLEKREYKVCLFEAKWPRLKINGRAWDSKQRRRNSPSEPSHFHTQLQKQQPFANVFAIWEMFYCEYEFKQQPGYMPDYLSSCVLHRHAFNASMNRSSGQRPWNDTDLENMLNAHGTQIGVLLEQVCNCDLGTPLSISDSFDYFDIRNIREFVERDVDVISFPKNITVIEYSEQSE